MIFPALRQRRTKYRIFGVAIEWRAAGDERAIDVRKTMGKDGEDEWVFDSLVGLLRGPVWNVPILTFIEHKSLSE